MNKIVPVEILLLFIQYSLSQFINYPPQYFNNKELHKYNFYNSNYDLNNNVQRRAKYRRKYRKKYNSESDYSESTDSMEKCSKCSCNECSKAKLCCRTMCNECKSLVLVPYPVPYLIPEMSSSTIHTTSLNTDATEKSKVTPTEKTVVTTSETTNKKTTSQTTQMTTITEIDNKEDIDSDTENSEHDIKPEITTTDIETRPDKETTSLSTSGTKSTYPVYVDSFNNSKFKYKLCPLFPKGACVPKKSTERKDNIENYYGAARKIFYERPLIQYQYMKTKQKKALRRTVSSTKSYWVPLQDIIPIPNEIAEKILSRI